MNQPAPDVSVIMPAYNAADHIRNAIASVHDQAWGGSLELLVIDDGSNDGTREVVQEFAGDGARAVRLLSNTRTKGPSGARNTGLLAARARYVAFLDADDLWYSNHLALAVGFLESSPTAGAVFFNFNVVDFATQEQVGQWHSKKKFVDELEVVADEDGLLKVKGDFISQLLDESFLHLQAMVFRNNLQKKQLFNEEVKRGEDRDFAIRLSLAGTQFAYSHIVTGIYYRHLQSLTSPNMQNRFNDVLDHILLYTGYLREPEICKVSERVYKIKSSLRKQYISAAYYYRSQRKYADAYRCLVNGLKYGFSMEMVSETLKLIAISTVGWARDPR